MRSPLKLQSLALTRNSLLKIGIAFGSGVLMGLAPAPVNLFPLAWVALAPLWVMVIQGKRRSLPLALAWGVGYHGLALSWITGLHPLSSLGFSWPVSAAIVLFCWLFITLWGAALVAIWAWGLRLLHPSALPLHPSALPLHPSLTRVLVGTALWCALEWIWSLGALYWTSLSYTQSPGNLAILHLGQLSGASLVTGAIVLVNGLLAEAWHSYHQNHQTQNSKLKTQNYLALAIGLLVLLHAIGFGLSSQAIAQPSESALKIGIVQGNVPTRIKLTEAGVRRAIAGYTNGYRQLADQGVDAVLTPEGALPILWALDATNPFYEAVLEKRVTAWLGTFVPQDTSITQSLLTLTGEGRVIGRYNKIKLVPLGEYIPFQEVLGRVIGRLSSLRFGMIPGTGEQRFETPFGRAIASICYESAFPTFFRTQAAAGGQFILTASNLDPYSEVLMAQHQAQDLMRAIETDRWAVRATNTGYSGVIDPHGHIVWRSQPRTYETHVETIFRRQTQTPYVRWGDWFTPTIAALGITLWLRRWMLDRAANRH